MDVAVCCYYKSNALLLLVTGLPLLLLLKFVLFLFFLLLPLSRALPFLFLILFYYSFPYRYPQAYLPYCSSSRYYLCLLQCLLFLLQLFLHVFYYYFLTTTMPCRFLFLKDQFISKHAISLLFCFCWQTFIFITNMNQCYSVCIHSLCIGFVNSLPLHLLSSFPTFPSHMLPPAPHTPLRLLFLLPLFNKVCWLVASSCYRW